MPEAEIQGANARELNRSLLSASRRAEKKTRLRAEWTSDDGTTQRFFDYVLKETTKLILGVYSFMPEHFMRSGADSTGGPLREYGPVRFK